MKTLAEKVDRLFTLRERKRRINDILKRIEEEYSPLELQIINDCETAGLDQARSTKATVSITTSVVPTVKDWDEYGKYILENQALYMLERRPAVGACRELFNAGESIPGVEPYEKKSLSMKKR